MLLAALLTLFVVFAIVRPAGNTRDAASAAVNTIWGDDPPAGAHGSCDYDPNAGLALLRARYQCVVKLCDEESARLEVTDKLLGGWSYKITRGGLPGYNARSGTTAPSESASPDLKPGNCER